jgi:hypothetical protein
MAEKQAINWHYFLPATVLKEILCRYFLAADGRKKITI